RLVVRGLVGEPVARFGPDGVWANRASPTAASDKLAKAGPGWVRLTRGHSLTWHDHRLAPPPGIPVGSTAPFALPVRLGGRAATLSLGSLGAFWHGVVISPLSPGLARLATAAAIVSGSAAAVLGVLAGDPKAVRR